MLCYFTETCYVHVCGLARLVGARHYGLEKCASIGVRHRRLRPVRSSTQSGVGSPCDFSIFSSSLRLLKSQNRASPFFLFYRSIKRSVIRFIIIHNTPTTSLALVPNDQKRPRHNILISIQASHLVSKK